MKKLSLAGKILYRNIFRIQMIANVLRSAWGNPMDLVFHSVRENMFVSDFESQRDQDRVRDGSSWHVSKHANFGGIRDVYAAVEVAV